MQNKNMVKLRKLWKAKEYKQFKIKNKINN